MSEPEIETERPTKDASASQAHDQNLDPEASHARRVDDRSIGEIFAEITADVPPEEWDKLPPDLSARWDYHRTRKPWKDQG